MTIRMLFAALACAAAAPLAAQEPMSMAARGDTLDLASAVALARAANPRVAAATAMEAAAGSRIRPAGTLSDPRLTIGAMNYMLPSLSPAGDPMTMNLVTLSQTIPINGSLGLRRTAARFDSSRAGWARQGTTLDVERDVRGRYWELYHVDRALDVMDRTIAVLRDLAAITSTLYGVGQTPQADVVRSQLAITRMQQEIVEMQLQRTIAAAALNALMARRADAPIVLPTVVHTGHAAMRALELPALPPLDSLLAAADSGSPELAGAEAAVDGARANETLSRRALVPDLEIGVSYGQRTANNDMVSLMVGASLPIFAHGRQLSQRDEATAMREATEHERRSRRLEVHAMLAMAHAEAQSARRQVEIFGNSLLPQAVAAYEAALSGYRVGRVDFTTVLDAQMALLEYQHDLHRYEAMFGTAIAAIDRLIGRSFGSTPWDR